MNMVALPWKYIVVILHGLLITHGNSQECMDSVRASVMPCVEAIVIASEFMNLLVANITDILITLCKAEMKAAMVCTVKAVKVCPDLAPNMDSIPAKVGLFDVSLDAACNTITNGSTLMPCLQKVFSSTKYASCITINEGFSDPDLYEHYRVGVICSILLMRQECPSMANNFVYNFLHVRPPSCPEEMKYILSQCVSEQLNISRFSKCIERAPKMFPDPDLPMKQVPCDNYKTLMSCLHDQVGQDCDRFTADYLVQWLRMFFRVNGDCTMGAKGAAPTILSPVSFTLTLVVTAFVMHELLL